MVVMRRFLFYNSDDLPQFKVPSLKVDKITTTVNGDSIGSGITSANTLTTATNKSARRVTLFEG